jgi:hypothetical protein
MGKQTIYICDICDRRHISGQVNQVSMVDDFKVTAGFSTIDSWETICMECVTEIKNKLEFALEQYAEPDDE